jgi:hypothetical protein
MKNFSDTIGNWTHDLPTCSTVPQQTVPPHTWVVIIAMLYFSETSLLVYHCQQNSVTPKWNFFLIRCFGLYICALIWMWCHSKSMLDNNHGNRCVTYSYSKGYYVRPTCIQKCSSLLTIWLCLVCDTRHLENELHIKLEPIKMVFNPWWNVKCSTL